MNTRYLKTEAIRCGARLVRGDDFGSLLQRLDKQKTISTRVVEWYLDIIMDNMKIYACLLNDLQGEIPEQESKAWRPIGEAQRDGTPILVYTSSGEYPFIVYFACTGRYTTSFKAWIGHEDGYITDNNIIGWMPLPDTGDTER